MELQGRILAHRGLWNKVSEQNTEGSIIGALRRGFGVELDLRDSLGAVLVSHDPPKPELGNLPRIEKILEKIPEENSGWVAFNVKSDGLTRLLPHFEFRHFFFDMSFPERRRFSSEARPIADRISDMEPMKLLPSGSATGVGFWVDCFEEDWTQNSTELSSVLALPGTKFFVSPELHGRDPQESWILLRELMRERPDVAICTDHPERFYDAF